MNLIRLPNLKTPIKMRMTPAINVASSRPSNPCFWTINRITVTKAAVGPEICTRLPPNKETMKPPIIAVKMPMAGAGNGVMIPGGKLATPKARASGKAMRPTVIPARTSSVASL